MDNFFSRNIGSVTRDQQLRLQKSTVTVVGCGGLGGYVIEELTRLGIGSLKICDPDTFSVSNINRQLYAQIENLGQYKAEVAAERVKVVHGQTTVLAITNKFQKAEKSLFANADVVVDCLDNSDSRRTLADKCNQLKIPLVYGAVQQWYGQVGVQLAGGTLIHDLYQSQLDDDKKPPSVLSCIVGVIAGMQVAETCKLLLGMDSPLHKNWMSIDLRRCTFELINHPKQRQS